MNNITEVTINNDKYNITPTQLYHCLITFFIILKIIYSSYNTIKNYFVYPSFILFRLWTYCMNKFIEIIIIYIIYNYFIDDNVEIIINNTIYGKYTIMLEQLYYNIITIFIILRIISDIYSCIVEYFEYPPQYKLLINEGKE